MNDAIMARMGLPMWMWLIAASGITWNVFKLSSWSIFSRRRKAILMMKGMTPLKAEFYSGLPNWMKLMFAIGSFGGLIGSVMLSDQNSESIHCPVGSTAAGNEAVTAVSMRTDT